MLGGLLLLTAPAASAAVIVVTTTDDDPTVNGTCTLRQAVQASNTNTAVDACAAGDASGDTIVLAAGMTSITLTLGEIVVTGPVEIVGVAGARISGGDASRIFRVTGGPFALTDLTLTNGLADEGGALWIGPGVEARLENVGVESSRSTGNGGGIWSAGALTLVDGRIEGNVSEAAAADLGGGGVYASGTLSVRGTVFDANLATTGLGNGGGLLVATGGAATVDAATFSANRAARAGGAIEAIGTLVVTGGSFVENETGINGGAIHLTGPTTTTVSGGTYLRNRAGREGGALWNSATGTLTVSDARVEDNEAQGAEANQGGGGVFSTGGPTVLTNVTLRGNRATGAAGSGGGVLSLGPLVMTGGLVEANTSVRAGGGVEINGGAGVVMTNVTVRGNDAGTAPGFGGGVHLTGTAGVRVVGGLIEGNTAVEGGGLWKSSPGTLSVEGTRVRANVATGDLADQGGGGVFSQGGPGLLAISDATITGNRATGTAGSGGGVFTDIGSVATITNTVVEANEASRAGGGIEDNVGQSLTLVNVTLRGNDAGTAPGNGGGLHLTGAGTVLMEGGLVEGNRAVEGGGLWKSQGGTLQVMRTPIRGNTASGAAADQGGGGIYNDGAGGTLLLTDLEITGNRATGAAGSGGGLLNNVGGVTTLRDVRIVGNEAPRAGGGIEDNAGGGLTLQDVDLEDNVTGAAPGNGGGLHITGPGAVDYVGGNVTGNSAAFEGGGLWNSAAGVLRVSDVTISDNDAPRGGGLFQKGAGGTFVAERVLVEGNTATVEGGGVFSEGGTFTVRNATLSGNDAPTGAGAFAAAGTLRLESATVAMNAATQAAGGVFAAMGATVTVQNSILALNTAPEGAQCAGGVAAEGPNVVFGTIGCTLSGTPVLDLDPGLQPLANNGGPTRTHALLAGSPAAGTGQTDLATDQRGFLRTGTPSLGAFEFGGQIVDGEGGPVPVVAAAGLSAAAPNPVRGTSRLWLTVERSEAVEVTLFDGLGRRVRTLWSGTAAPGASVEIALDAAGLAPGMYVVQMAGETVRASQRVTVVP